MKFNDKRFFELYHSWAKITPYRGVGTGEAGEAPASPEIRGLQTNFWGKSAKKLAIFEVASPEIILFLRPWTLLL